MTTRTIAEESPRQAQGKRFYRPELDALRFFAFFGVLIFHGPPGYSFFGIIRSAGAFGLSMFFLLSAYLITELLLREVESTGTVSWSLFFIRRALRIWPLYYAALAIGVAISLIPPHRYAVSRTALVVLSLFVANWSRLAPQLGILIGHLWSISIEEQFYLIWPPLIKFGGRKLAFLASIVFLLIAGIWIAAFPRRAGLLWYDTPVEFLYFAAGAILALTLHTRSMNSVTGLIRAALLAGGLILLGVAAHFGLVLKGTAAMYIQYGASVAGCVAIFLAVAGVPKVPQVLVYLGKISYGLYVFHLGMLQLAFWLTSGLRLPYQSAANVLVVDGLALALCILTADLSYRFFEKPFMKMKERFAVIQSRPA